MRRRRRWLWIPFAILLVTVAVSVAIATRHRSRYEWLYDMHPAVGEFSPTSTSFPWGFPVSTGSPYRGAYSLMVFTPEQGQRLSSEFDRRFPNANSYSTFVLFTPPGNRFRGDIKEADDRGNPILLLQGDIAFDAAATSHLVLPPAGYAIVVGEPPDWFAVRLHAVLAFFHLA